MTAQDLRPRRFGRAGRRRDGRRPRRPIRRPPSPSGRGRNPTAAASGAIATLSESWTDTSSGSWSSNQKFGSLAALTAGGRNVTASASGMTIAVSFQPNADGSFRVICGSPKFNGSTAAATVASQLLGHRRDEGQPRTDTHGLVARVLGSRRPHEDHDQRRQRRVLREPARHLPVRARLREPGRAARLAGRRRGLLQLQPGLRADGMPRATGSGTCACRSPRP